MPYSFNDKLVTFIRNQSRPTPAGLEKMQSAGKILAQRGIQFDMLWVSPLLRALLSAEALGLGVEIVIKEALAERNFGAFTGMSKKAIKEKPPPGAFHNYLYNKYFFPPDITSEHPFFRSKSLYGTWPNNHKSESYQCVINRLLPLVAEIKQQLLAGKNIVVVGHSHNLQVLQMLLHGTPFEQGIEQYKIEHATPIEFIFDSNYPTNLMIKEK